jgi:O-acetyl-ADP-ribose deacetylase (regulator of RNase III)
VEISRQVCDSYSRSDLRKKQRRRSDPTGRLLPKLTSRPSEHQLATIAFPSISTGAFGYPRDEAAAISSAAIANSLAGRQTIAQVRLVFFQPSDAKVFLQYQIFE